MHDEQRCQSCLSALGEGVASALCRRCWRSFPAALVKALVDPFDYAVGLRDGTVIRFTRAEIQGHYVHLAGVSEWNYLGRSEENIDRYVFGRGVDVRLEDVVWAADGPEEH